MKLTIDSQGLDSLLQNLQTRDSYLRRLNGQDVDESQDRTVISGPMLHEDTEHMSEEESAQFELDHPEIIRFFQSLKQQLNDEWSK